MKNPPLLQTPRRRTALVFAAAILFASAMLHSLRAADVTWTNMSGSFLWNTTDMNWSNGVWNNAAGDGAVFGATGLGTVNIPGPVNANSIGFTVNGYALTGSGPINLVAGNSSLGTGYVFVDLNQTNTISAPINSSQGLSKTGGGTLQLAGPISFSGIGLPATIGTNIIPVDIYAAGLSQSTLGGTIQVMNTGVLPATTRLGLTNGRVDFLGNNITLGSVTFTNDQDTTPFDPGTGSAGVGIIGTGTLRVTGEINVLSNPGGFNSGSNSIAMNLDLGGGTQIIRTAGGPAFSSWAVLQLTGVLSNGSLLKTYSFNPFGQMVTPDGIGLFGNNTYTGATIINGGLNTVTGTNASTYVEIAGPGTLGTLSLQGANGSFLSAPTVLAASGGTLALDNNAGITSSTSPSVPAAQNNNRLADNVNLQLRDGGFTYRGLSNAAATEAIGTLSVLGGHNVITLTPNGTGTAAVTVAGDLTMAPRSTLTVQSTSLAVNGRMYVNGMLPAADATGILPRMVSSTDFLTYNGTTGFTNYTGYATDFSTAGTNVSVTAASTVSSSVNINALKRGTTSFATTIAAGQTLGITSGMILSSGGTGTFTGGTIAFGSAPGTFFGSNTVSSAISGTAGLLNATGTLTLSGDLSGLTGTITQNGFGTTTLNTNTFGGAIEVREGTLNINTSQTLAGQGAITMGVSANRSNLIAATPSLNISAAGANAIIGRDLVVDNGALNSAGVRYAPSFVPGISPLSNSTGSQTFSGNFTLNSPLRLQGGGASATSTGATNFTGAISGSSYFQIANGRAVFSGNLSNAGGFYIGQQGTRSDVTFNGTVTGSASLDLNGATSNLVKYTAGALPTGIITTVNVDQFSVPYLVPLDNSTINNDFHLDGVYYNLVSTPAGGDVGGNVGAGISATWAGQISGLGGIFKTGAGTLTLSHAGNTYSGQTTINAGTLVASADGALGTGNVSLNAASVVLMLQNGTANRKNGATNNYIADTATLNIGFTNDTVNLGFSGTDTIKALVINGVPQAPGTWGAPGSGAMHTDPVFTGSGMLNVLTQLTASAVSRRNHGGTNFDVPLPGVESRQGGGATNDYTMVVTLSEPVTQIASPRAQVIAGSGTVGSNGAANANLVTVDGSTVTIPLTNITSGQTIQVRINGVNGFSNIVIPMSVLVGDVNGNGSVSASDIAQTKALSGQGVNAANFRTDVNVSGDINATDISLVKSLSGTSLP